MPFDGSGNFSRAFNWVNDKVAGIKIIASRMDGEFDNYANGMNQTMLRTGVVPMGGPLNMGGNTINSLGSGTAAVPAIRFSADPSSGVFMPAINQVAVSVAGVQGLVVTPTGVTVAGNIYVTGGSITVPNVYIDTNFWMAIQAGNPIINFDANDFIRFNRGPNQYEFNINASTQLLINPSSVQVGNSGSGIVYLGSGTSYLQTDPSQSTWLMDSSYYWQHNKSTKILSLVMGGPIAMDVRPGSVNVNIPFNVSSNIQSVTGVIRTQNPSIGDVLLQAGNASVSGFMGLLQVDDAVHGYIGQQPPNGAIQYWSNGGGHNFVGPITAGDYTGTGIVRAVTFYADPSFYMTMSGPNSLINWDAGDYIYYERATNQYNFVANGVNVLNLATGSAVAHGIELGYKDLLIRDVNTPGGNLGGGDRGRAVRFVAGAGNYGVPDLGANSIVTVINHSGVTQTLVEVGCSIYWAATNTAGAVNLQPGAVATIIWVPGAACTISGTGVFR